LRFFQPGVVLLMEGMRCLGEGDHPQRRRFLGPLLPALLQRVDLLDQFEPGGLWPTPPR
jgi:hypothetical protein